MSGTHLRVSHHTFAAQYNRKHGIWFAASDCASCVCAGSVGKGLVPLRLLGIVERLPSRRQSTPEEQILISFKCFSAIDCCMMDRKAASYSSTCEGRLGTWSAPRGTQTTTYLKCTRAYAGTTFSSWIRTSTSTPPTCCATWSR